MLRRYHEVVALEDEVSDFIPIRHLCGVDRHAILGPRIPLDPAVTRDELRHVIGCELDDYPPALALVAAGREHLAANCECRLAEMRGLFRVGKRQADLAH